MRKKLSEENAEPATPTGSLDSSDKLPLRPIHRDESILPPTQILTQERRLAWWRRLAVASEPLGPWGGVAALVERTYWSRIWIVQEYLLAAETVLHCGWDYMDGKRFDKAVSIIGELFERSNADTPKPTPSIQNFLERIANSPGIKIPRRRIADHDRTLLELMETCKTSKSCDPHDRIYAILGLALDIPPEAILVDYERSIFKVKMDVAWWYLTESGLKSDPASISRVCSVLDEIFADCDEED